MNEGPDFQPSAEEDARDPLLSALRQRLGEGFGQEPPPALWASIRQQLPPAPHPWWLRGRRPLALLVLLGGVLLGGVAGWLASSSKPAASLARRPAGQPAAGSVAGSTHWPAGPGQAATRTVGPGLLAVAERPRNATASPAAANRPAAWHPRATPAARATAGRTVKATAGATATHPATGAALPAGAATRRPASTGASAEPAGRTAYAWARRRAVTSVASGSASLEAARPARAAARPPATRFSAAGAVGAYAAKSAAIKPVIRKNRRRIGFATRHFPRRQPAAATGRPTSPGAAPADAAAGLAASSAAAGGRRRPGAHSPLRAGAGALAAGPPAGAGAWLGAAGPMPAGVRPAAPDSLAGRRARLLRAALALPARLAARPDPAGPWLPLARRWSVLALAGPTLSYRTIRSASASGLAYSPLPTTAASAGYTSSSTSSSGLAGSERAAPGLGAQVQARRVLTGRWALALGAGYQEYAAWLTTQVTIVRAANGTAPDTTFAVNHRETYRFLTLPVQLSYALGPPRGRFGLGLLGGLEPGWYRGGSATLLTGTTARTLAFSSAADSPYNAFNLAVSLGLDACYRLGGAASRWQLVLQPTARYVATPFVRGNASGYASRQPCSVGLLTGFSWQLR